MQKESKQVDERSQEAYIKIVQRKKKDLKGNLLTAKEINKMSYFKPQEAIVKYISLKTQNKSPGFFRLITIYVMATMASTMRTRVDTPDRGLIPVNVYCMNFSGSGSGKGYSVYLAKTVMLSKFVKRYFKTTHIDMAAKSINRTAIKKSIKTGEPEHKVKADLMEIYLELGESLFTFDSGTTPAIKQYRGKLLMGGTGALNMQVDEIGSNLTTSGDVLDTFLELFDMGLVGDKLLKETKESKRIPMKEGATPANMLLFGTPTKVFDGAKIEALLREYINIGMGRRCFVNYSPEFTKVVTTDANKIYSAQTKDRSDKFLKSTVKYFGTLANEMYHGQKLKLPKASAILLIRYEVYCLLRSLKIHKNKEDEKAHLLHAHWRVLKLAGVYAFIDKSPLVSTSHIKAAIRMSEDSYKDFSEKVTTQEHNFIRLAKFIGNVGAPLTHTDIIKELPFYPQNKGQREEMLLLAISWGSTNNISIRVTNKNSIDIITGSMLKRTDKKNMILAFSKEHHTYKYRNVSISLKHLAKFSQGEGWHFINHHLKGEHRHGNNVRKGFNMVVLDIDKSVHIETVKVLFKKYAFILYTTKRHTAKKPRFRLIMPISHVMHMKEKEFAGFMSVMYKWLPFKVDKQTNQRSRKWLTDTGASFYNKGKLLDSISFIPKTPKANNIITFQKNFSSFDNLERWYISKIKDGNRSNTLIKYGFVLRDAGKSFKEIKATIFNFNDRLGKDLAIPKDEIRRTVLYTVKKNMHKRSK